MGGGRISVERFTKVSYCALTGLAFSAAFRTQGVAPWPCNRPAACWGHKVSGGAMTLQANAGRLG